MSRWMYVGAWSLKGEGGIAICSYDEDTGIPALKEIVRTDVVAGQMYLDREKDTLYVTDEMASNADWGIGGRVFSFHADPETGALTETGRDTSYGVLPDYVCSDGTGTGIIVGNHSSGTAITRAVRGADGSYFLQKQYADTTIVHYALKEDGSLGRADDMLVLQPENGIYSCIHSVNLAPLEPNTVLACDRNMDRLYKLRWEPERNKLVIGATLDFEHVRLEKGGFCTRYTAFHPALPIVYVNSEYTQRLAVVRYSRGLKQQQIAEFSMPEGMAPAMPSDLCVNADGTRLYLLCRKSDAAVTFALDAEGNALQMDTVKLRGSGPRGCRLSPDGRFLLVAETVSGAVETLPVLGNGTLGTAAALTGGMPNAGNLIIR